MAASNLMEVDEREKEQCICITITRMSCISYTSVENALSQSCDRRKRDIQEILVELVEPDLGHNRYSTTPRLQDVTDTSE